MSNLVATFDYMARVIEDVCGNIKIEDAIRLMEVSFGRLFRYERTCFDINGRTYVQFECGSHQINVFLNSGHCCQSCQWSVFVEAVEGIMGGGDFE